MVADSVEFLRDHDLRVFFDAEHFFDGYKDNPEFTLRILRAAEEAGAEALVLCDTNGGTLPHDVERIVAERPGRLRVPGRRALPQRRGLRGGQLPRRGGRGATHVQGCVNGYGERTGNADLSAAIPNLSLKLGCRTIPADRLERLTPVSHHIAELVNIAPNPQQPYVGRGGLRPQGRSAHQRHRPSVRRLRAHLARLGRQRHPVRGVGDGRPVDPGPQGRRSSASSSTPRPCPRCSTRSRGSSTGGTTSRWPTARSSCCCGTRPDGSRSSSRSSRSGSSPTTGRVRPPRRR